MNQRGLALIGLILYGVAAAAVIAGLWWAIDEWKDGQAAQAEVKAAWKECPDNVKSEAEGVAACLKLIKERYTGCLESIGRQNEAIAKLEKTTKAALAEAKAARQKADKAHASTKPERERLARLEKEFKATGTCPAGQAVQDVRRGLRP